MAIFHFTGQKNLLRSLLLAPAVRSYWLLFRMNITNAQSQDFSLPYCNCKRARLHIYGRLLPFVPCVTTKYVNLHADFMANPPYCLFLNPTAFAPLYHILTTLIQPGTTVHVLHLEVLWISCRSKEKKTLVWLLSCVCVASRGSTGSINIRGGGLNWKYCIAMIFSGHVMGATNSGEG